MAGSPDPTLVALHRFGLGARPGDRARMGADPRGFVLAQLNGPVPATGANLPASDEASRQRQAEEAARKQASQRPAPAAMAEADADKDEKQHIEITLFRAEAGARLQQLASAERGLIERLVLFWSNHFTVSATKGAAVRAVAGAFEREAIRPHVLGRFADMLMAVEQHPAMLIYLYNTQSFGPNSRAGQRRERGLNENLARETLELHTLGVDGGYGQADVGALARIYTGWGITGPQQGPPDGGRFNFDPSRHEPGPQTLLGRAYPEKQGKDGVEQGRAALADLARPRRKTRSRLQDDQRRSHERDPRPH